MGCAAGLGVSGVDFNWFFFLAFPLMLEDDVGRQR